MSMIAIGLMLAQRAQQVLVLVAQLDRLVCKAQLELEVRGQLALQGQWEQAE
jgi:hypothetical protein